MNEILKKTLDAIEKMEEEEFRLRIESAKPKLKPISWESEEEWQLETDVFNWNSSWSEEETRSLTNNLWFQYVNAANPDKEVE